MNSLNDKEIRLILCVDNEDLRLLSAIVKSKVSELQIIADETRDHQEDYFRIQRLNAKAMLDTIRPLHLKLTGEMVSRGLL